MTECSGCGRQMLAVSEEDVGADPLLCYICSTEGKPKEQTTVARVRVNGVMEYAMGISKKDATWLKGFLSAYLGPASKRIQDKCDWVIAQADKGMDEHL